VARPVRGRFRDAVPQCGRDCRRGH
jgi:hypothetical protein